MMRSWLLIITLGLSALLAGCTTTPVVRSEVTTFHEWPAQLQQASFVFELGPEQQNNLEYRAYQSLVREELERLGFRAADNPETAQLKVSFRYGIDARDVRVVESAVADPGFGPFYSSYWGYPYWGNAYGPFYDPFWHSGYSGPRESQYVLYTRRLNITIARAADKRNLFDVTVVSEGRNGNLASVMPYLVKSAFADFPGPSGVPRRIELKTTEERPRSGQEELPE